MRLEGKIAIVTGGASGIGKATAKLFAREGAKLMLVDLNDTGGEVAAEEIRAGGGTAAFVQADLTKTGDVARAVARTVERYGTVNVLHNNAGLFRFGTVVDSTEEQWDQIIAINLKSVFLMSKYVLPHLIAARHGSIINTASIGGMVGVENGSAYAAAKGGVIQLTKSMALDYGPAGIRVNCICPGSTDTPMLHGIWKEENPTGVPADIRQQYADGRPLRSIATPDDIANAALYLASDESRFVTGTSLVVDGGVTAM